MRKLVLIAVMALVGSLGVAVAAASPAAADSPAGELVSETPANFTPHVLDGRVKAVAQVGDTIILGGNFDRTRNQGSNTEIGRSNLMAFDRSTGQISTSFVPNPNGTVNAVLPAGDGETVYVGGSFRTISGQSERHLARIRVSDGSVVNSFHGGSPTGSVTDLKLAGGRLWVGGTFSGIAGSSQSSLATLDAQTGAFDPYMGLEIAGTHRDGYTGMKKFDINPAGTRLVGIGNFDTLEGVKNHQMFVLNISGGSAQPANFQTGFYETGCSRSFDTYMRDLDFSPDGSFFVISTTGAYGGSTGACDQTARWETDSTGSDLDPSWVDYTGGDTTYAVEITDTAVYVGGHQRWQNNAFAGDRPGPGAVSREGIAALDPVNGLPMSWNPGRARGVGVFDMLNTSQGLWVASDTDRIGNWTYHGKIALMPANGKNVAAVKTPTLPNDVYAASSDGLVRRSYESGAVGNPQNVPGGGLNWNNVRGTFMVNGYLYTAWSNGTFTRQTFDGSSFGSPEAVDTADQLVNLADWDGDASQATGMFFDSGRLYFTRAGSSDLYYRYFTPESGVVGAKRFTASGNVNGISFSQVRGMFTTGNALFWATPDGNLHQMDWADGALNGAPVPGTESVVSGPGQDGNDWESRSLFLFQDENGNGAGGPANVAPSAEFTRSCDGLACDFDGGSSSDSDGTVASYAWDFGDGGSSTAQAPSHTFAADGDYQVELTVTDDDGATDSITKTVSVDESAPATDLAFVGAQSSNGNHRTHSVQVPSGVQAGDTLVLFATVNNDNADVSGPAGWSQLEAVNISNLQGRAWTRTATAGDAGSSVQMETSGFAKADLSVAAYRADGGSSVAASAGGNQAGSATSLTTPQVDVADPGSWVLSYWGSKDGSTPTWSTPAGVEQRSVSDGSGGGRINALLADSDGAVPTGTQGGVTAELSTAANRAAMFSIVLQTG